MTPQEIAEMTPQEVVDVLNIHEHRTYPRRKPDNGLTVDVSIADTANNRRLFVNRTQVGDEWQWTLGKTVEPRAKEPIEAQAPEAV
jgi:hypothetical protein